jgi:hypothetical protein
MEWLILCLLVPAVVVPVVLLWGFAGCSFQPGVAPPPLTPQNLVATPISVSEISLTWDNPDPGPVQFEVHRAQDGTQFALLATVAGPPFVDPTNLPTPTPLGQGITFNYQVFAVSTNDPGNRSSGSNVASARPLAFAADLSVTQQIPIPPPNYTFVLRISPARLHNSGSQVRLTVRGAPSGNVTINSIYISRAALSGNPYDSLPAGNPGGLTQVASAVLLPDDQPKALDFVAYPLDPSQDLLIAFDFTAAAGQAEIRYDPSPGVALYFGLTYQEAGVPNRTAGYVAQADPRSYLVTQIEVL